MRRTALLGDAFPSVLPLRVVSLTRSRVYPSSGVRRHKHALAFRDVKRTDIVGFTKVGSTINIHRAYYIVGSTYLGLMTRAYTE